MDEEDVRTVLVVFGERSRQVFFKASGTYSVKEVLMRAITETYRDVVGDSKLFLQIKDDSWGGMFVDLQEQEVTDRSVIRAVPVQVSIHVYLFNTT